MIDAFRQTYRSLPGFHRVVKLLALEVVMVGWWMQSAFHSSIVTTKPMDAVCSKMPEYDFTSTVPIEAEWSWFPPGVECYADTGGGMRLYHSPSWLTVLTPTVLAVIVGIALLGTTAALLFRAALSVRGRMLVTGGGLLCVVELIAVAAFPFAFFNLGGLAIVWGPLALLVAGALLVVSGRLLRPVSATALAAERLAALDAEPEAEPESEADGEPEPKRDPKPEPKPKPEAEPEPAGTSAGED